MGIQRSEREARKEIVRVEVRTEIRPATPVGKQSRDGFGGVSQGAERGETRVAMSLGEATTILRDDERDMDEVGRGKSECAIEQYLPRSGGKKVVAPQDFGDAHGGIVDDNGERIPSTIFRTG